jgi:hypothetical protein
MTDEPKNTGRLNSIGFVMNAFSCACFGYLFFSSWARDGSKGIGVSTVFWGIACGCFLLVLILRMIRLNK